MKHPKIDISKKITLLNQTILDSMMEKSDKKIIRDFTEASIKILEADFGWAWWKLRDKEEYELAYKSKSTIFSPPPPRNKFGNYTAIKTQRPFFDNNVRPENYKFFNYSRYMKSYIIIPICYGEHVYGTLILCFKSKEKFTAEKLALAQSVGSATAQAITIHRYIETDILLAQEKSKTDFIANITHELRTPLTIMRGYIYLAQQKGSDKNATIDALQVIDKEIVHLSEMLSDLVLVTSGSNLPVNFAAVDIHEVISSVVKRLRPLADEKGIKIMINGTNTFVVGDKRYLERVFLNIIKNAITYGGSKIDVRIASEKNKTEISVKDDGIGISKEDLPKIFERFYRADKSRTRSQNRTGLGLSIAQTIAEMHEGKINVKSTLGKGSIFTVTLPKKPSKPLRKA